VIPVVPTPTPGVLQVGGKLPFDKLRANGQAFPFALSREPVERSKGKFAPKLKYADPRLQFQMKRSLNHTERIEHKAATQK
jgi:hypothetical protein